MHKLFSYSIIVLFFFSIIACQDDLVRSKQKDEQKLSTLLAQIKALAEQVKCENEADWKFIAYGQKACGGPIGYITYSDKVDNTNFLKMIDQYTDQQKEFNKKWSVISDCSIAMQPKSVVCDNGKPKLVY